jgi:hypothetical protein
MVMWPIGRLIEQDPCAEDAMVRRSGFRWLAESLSTVAPHRHHDERI